MTAQKAKTGKLDTLEILADLGAILSLAGEGALVASTLPPKPTVTQIMVALKVIPGSPLMTIAATVDHSATPTIKAVLSQLGVGDDSVLLKLEGLIETIMAQAQS